MLIESTLSSLPTYFMSLFSLPAAVEKSLNKIQQNFLWNGIEGDKKFHLVNWKKVCFPVECSGIGIKKFRVFNRALRRKWLCRCGQEPDRLWRKIIDSKLVLRRGGWVSKKGKEAYGVGLCRDIRKQRNRFSDCISFNVGNGEKVKFWSDLWCGEVSLSAAFPALCRMAVNRNAWIADYVRYNTTGVFGEPVFLRNLQDWETDALQQFFQDIYKQTTQHGKKDGLIWRKGKEGFSVKHSYKDLVGGNPFAPHKLIWKTTAPIKVKIFIWTVAMGKVLKEDNLEVQSCKQLCFFL